MVFETWQTPEDVKAENQQTDLSLHPIQLRQLSRGQGLVAEDTVLGSVKYDPSAAEHILQNGLFHQSELDRLLTTGARKVPDFPSTAIALKPVFETIAEGDLVDGRYYQMPTWPGPPGDTLPGPSQAFPSADWGQCVWIDLGNEGQGDGLADASCLEDGSSRTPATTYSLDDFIHFEIGEKRARLMNLQNEVLSEDLPPFQAGDPSILQAMHVTSRETSRWTWQTFWWSHRPNSPHFPSSQEFAENRPEQLQGAARHYAQAVAYSMVSPPQPDTGWKDSEENNGIESLYAYNPYLEAGFGPDLLPDSKGGYYDGRAVSNHVGIQTNCASCHANANYNPQRLPNAPKYTGDRYVDLDSEKFDGTLQLDFLWSINGNKEPEDSETSLVYNSLSGELAVDVGTNASVDSILIDSASGIFVGDSPENLDGEYDIYGENEIFKFTSSAFESFSFGDVAKPGLSEEFLLNDLAAIALTYPREEDAGPINLIYVPEPASRFLGGGLTLMSAWFMRRRMKVFPGKRFRRKLS